MFFFFLLFFFILLSVSLSQIYQIYFKLLSHLNSKFRCNGADAFPRGFGCNIPGERATLDGLYSYVWPQRVWIFRCFAYFGHK